MPFSRESAYLMPEEGPFDWLKRDLDGIIKTLVMGLVAVLTIMLVVKPLVSKAFDISSSDLEAEELKIMADQENLRKQAMGIGNTLGSDGGGVGDSSVDGQVNLDVIQSKIDYSPTQQINDLIDNNPDETLNIIRSWLVENR